MSTVKSPSMEMALEVVAIFVSDVDRSLQYYSGLELVCTVHCQRAIQDAAAALTRAKRWW